MTVQSPSPLDFALMPSETTWTRKSGILGPYIPRQRMRLKSDDFGATSFQPIRNQKSSLTCPVVVFGLTWMLKRRVWVTNTENAMLDE